VSTIKRELLGLDPSVGIYRNLNLIAGEGTEGLVF
jgi:hypothetical protein